jgi:FkbM family methyltransferase
LSVLAKFGDLYAYLFGRQWLARAHRALFYLSGRALGLYNYSSESISGETAIMGRLLDGIAQPVVFDVGANDGVWSAAVLRLNPRAVLHAFEPQETLAQGIASRLPQVKVNRAALGESPGTLQLHDYADHPGSQHASLVPGVIDQMHGGTVRSTDVPVLTLDGYCAEHAIAAIDLLKVDVEGYELQVLRGARQMLAEGRVRSIQFEVTHLNVLGRVFIEDFFTLLGDQYALYRLLPHGLTRLHRPSHWFNEQFGYQNIVALKHS